MKDGDDVICQTCGASYKPCKCQGGKCPICLRAKRRKLVLVEYIGADSSHTVGRVTFSKGTPRSYVRPENLATMLNDPSVRRVT